MRLLIAGVLAALIVAVAVLALPPLGARWEWPVTLTYVLIGPGVYICRWFLSPAFSTPTGRLWIIAAVNFLVYWPAILFLLELLPDRRRMWRALTFQHVLAALAVGAGASFLSYRLNIVSPRIFGILTTPSSLVIWVVSLVASRQWWLRSIQFLHLVGGLVGYSVIAFLALFRLVWRESA